ncbi:MAG TPA: efflux RND transporter periplasmic adaptor subunit [Dysgonamonadaceae bacterium]|nr:efflux RND transporter periplasmic adaptor subunit [Dysgonamonadaceae bacterium]
MNMKKNVLFAVCLVLMTTACSTQNKSEENEVKAVRVTVTESVETEYHPILNYSGTAEANRKVNLASSLPGRIEKIYYKKGDFVAQGAKIVELSDEMLIQAQVENETIKKDYERLSRLKEKGSISLIDFDHIKAKYEASEAKVKMLKKNTTITAPFSGILVDIYVEEGENYSFVPSMSADLKIENGIVSLMQLNPLKVKIEVNEKELPLIHKGNEVEVAFDAYPEEKVIGKIHYISPVLSSVTRTSSVEVEIPNTSLKFKPGMFCRASLELPAEKGVFVPVNAIYRQPGTGEEFVFVVNDDNTVSRISVKRGEMVKDQVHISEIAAGVRVVIDGKSKLDEGTLVEIVEE